MLLTAGAVLADVRVPVIFSEHLVLQRDLNAPIWGTAEPGEKVTVRFAGQEKSVTTGADKRWLVRLDPLPAGGPHQLVIVGRNTITIDDVLVGEVWLGSGQSNMATPAWQYFEHDPVLAQLVRTEYPQVRFLTKDGWRVTRPQAAADFSALMFAFGVRLQEALKVPVGLVVSAVNNTTVSAWLSVAALQSNAACQAMLKEFVASGKYAAALEQHQAEVAKWEKYKTEAEAHGKKEIRPGPSAPAKPGEFRDVGELYRKVQNSVQPYGLRGVLWDQGESGVGKALIGLDINVATRALIDGWRKDWGQGEFPFLYVQKPSGCGLAYASTNTLAQLPKFLPSNAGSREFSLLICQHPGTFIVPSSDLSAGLHPPGKSAYGARAANVALGAVYGRDVAISGPQYKSHQIDGDKVRIHFTQIGRGLVKGPGPALQGFAVAGEDKVYRWADAVIDGDAVVVNSPQVSHPVAVRYAWAYTIDWANLFNQDGLPALSFRTDNW